MCLPLFTCFINDSHLHPCYMTASLIGLVFFFSLQLPNAITMRRSNAPSMLNSRSKFTPPVAKKPRLNAENENPMNAENKCSASAIVTSATSTTGSSSYQGQLKDKAVSLLDLMRDPAKIQVPQKSRAALDSSSALVSSTTVVENRNSNDSPMESKPFAPAPTLSKPSLPTFSKSQLPHSSSPASSPRLTPSMKPSLASPSCDANSNDWNDSLFFSCVYAKHSTRKHKKWEGDGVLIVKGKSVTLKVSLWRFGSLLVMN